MLFVIFINRLILKDIDINNQILNIVFFQMRQKAHDLNKLTINNTEKSHLRSNLSFHKINRWQCSRYIDCQNKQCAVALMMLGSSHISRDL